MHIHPRHRAILDLLEEKGEVRVSDLCGRFSVSEMTIRRDLAELERSGLLRRIYGGAVNARGRSYEPPFLSRAGAHQFQKERIGKLAADLIHDGESIALDVGTTTLEIARALKERSNLNLTIITASLHITNVLANSPGIRLIVVGGVLRFGELSLVGHLAERAFREFYVDKLFLGVGGISLEAGLTEFNLEDALVKQAMLKTAKERYVVANSSKLGRIAFTHIAPLNDVHVLITDSEANEKVIQALREHGLRVMLA